MKKVYQKCLWIAQCYGKYDSLPDEQELQAIRKIVAALPYK
ncbi:hypothetical protein [Enterococcus hirae]|nr:hypothetical protein [Enterococcus hirae]